MPGKRVFTLVYMVLICRLCWGSREPQCSQYHFLEQLLDKMVRAEVKVEGLQKHVDDGLAEFRATLEAFRQDLDKDREMHASQIAQQTKTVQQVVDKLKTQKGELSLDPVAFEAQDLANSNVAKGQKYVFSTIVFNHGDGYDNTNGIFTAPQVGLYIFITNICGVNLKYVCVNFHVNGTGRSRSCNYASAGETCNSLQLVTMLQKEDKLWLEATYESNTKTDGYRLNTFSGALVQPY